MNRLDTEMSGTLNAEDMMVWAWMNLSINPTILHMGKLLYEVIDFYLPAPGAIVIGFSRLAPMLGLLKKFDRAAIVTHKIWLRRVSELDGLLYPSREMKPFDRNQKKEAEAWLSS
jgi:hypothetical protein